MARSGLYLSCVKTDSDWQAYEVSTVMQRLFINDPDDEWLQSDVQKAYDVDFRADFDETILSILEIASSELCNVSRRCRFLYC